MKTKLNNELILETFFSHADKLGLKTSKTHNSVVITDKKTRGFKFQAIITRTNAIEYTINKKSFTRSYTSKEEAYKDVLQTAKQTAIQ